MEELMIFEPKKTSYEEFLAFQMFENRSYYMSSIDDQEAYEFTSLVHIFNQQDNYLEPEDRKPIRVFTNSPGGSVISCLQIIDTIELSKTPIYTYATGGAYSAGGLILLAGHKRFAYPHASFLWHEGSIFAGGDVGKMKNLMAFQGKQDDLLKQFVTRRTNINEEILKEKLHDDWWMTAEEMVDYGIVDEIIKEIF